MATSRTESTPAAVRPPAANPRMSNASEPSSHSVADAARAARQQRAALRTVLVLALVSIGFYVAFFVEHYLYH